jgi:hypothetical protein
MKFFQTEQTKSSLTRKKDNIQCQQDEDEKKIFRLAWQRANHRKSNRTENTFNFGFQPDHWVKY